MDKIIISLIIGLIYHCTAHKPSSHHLRIETVAGPYDLSEGPHWDSAKQVLYFVDIHRQNIYCLNPKTKRITKTFIKNGPVGVAIPVANKKNTFIAGSGRDFVKVIWDSEFDNLNPTVEILAKVDVDKNITRFNDGKIDPMGRFWAGTMGQANSILYPNEGTLYRFESGHSPAALIRSVSISNGLTWSHDNRTFYWIDTPTDNVYGFNYDKFTGNISNQRVVFNFPQHNVPGHPDGMTIDNDGNLWIACYNGKRVIQIDPKTGKLLRQIMMPVNQITSVAFGGKDLDVLYVTSTKENLSEEENKAQPLAGSVFAVYGLGAVGRPMLSYKL